MPREKRRETKRKERKGEEKEKGQSGIKTEKDLCCTLYSFYRTPSRPGAPFTLEKLVLFASLPAAAAALLRQAELPEPDGRPRGGDGGSRLLISARQATMTRQHRILCAPCSHQYQRVPGPAPPPLPPRAAHGETQVWDSSPRNRLQKAPALTRTALPPSTLQRARLAAEAEPPLTLNATTTSAANSQGFGSGPRKANSEFPPLEMSPPELEERPPLLPSPPSTSRPTSTAPFFQPLQMSQLILQPWFGNFNKALVVRRGKGEGGGRGTEDLNIFFPKRNKCGLEGA